MATLRARWPDQIQVLQLFPERVATLPQVKCVATAGSWAQRRTLPMAAPRCPPRLMNSRPGAPAAGRSCSTNTPHEHDFTLSTADNQSPTRKNAPTHPQKRQTWPVSGALSQPLSVDGEWRLRHYARVLDEATLFNIAGSRVPAPRPGRALLEHVIDEVETRRRLRWLEVRASNVSPMRCREQGSMGNQPRNYCHHSRRTRRRLWLCQSVVTHKVIR